MTYETKIKDSKTQNDSYRVEGGKMTKYLPPNKYEEEISRSIFRYRNIADREQRIKLARLLRFHLKLINEQNENESMRVK